MIVRIWHGWTTPQNADAYEHLLMNEIFEGIYQRQIEGFRNLQLLRRVHHDEVEFITIMHFESLDAVRTFAGAAYEQAVVLEPARRLLLRFDATAQHYELRQASHVI